jgi:hypothetical protein
MRKQSALIVTAMAILALLLPNAIGASPVEGELYELQLTSKSETKGSNSSGSSSGRDAMSVRTIAVRADGVEFEYDLPPGTTAEDRQRNWQFPFRVFRPIDGGPIRLLNAPELDARVDKWLALGQMTREACGKWIFTWNAFKIECDPQSVLSTLAVFDPQPQLLVEGALYSHSMAVKPTTLRYSAGPDGGSTYKTTLAIDADKVRQEKAEADVVVGQITGEPISAEQAQRKRAKMQVSGTIEVTLETDPSGNVIKRTVIYKMELIDADGEGETSLTTEVLTRKPISRSAE